MQPAENGSPVLCNGSVLKSSQWLRHGDRVDLGGTALGVEIEGDTTRLKLGSRLVDAGARSAGKPAVEGAGTPPEIRIRPVRFEPSRWAASGGRRRLPALTTALVWLFLAALAGAAWYVFTATPVRVVVTPEPELLEIEGGLVRPRIAGRHLLRPGSYTVIAEREGYRRLEAPFEVGDGADPEPRFELEAVPARLAVTVEPADAGARVRIDGADRGEAPLEGVELEVGEHLVSVEAAGFAPFEETVTVERPGTSVELHARLTDLRAPVTFTSEPSGVAVVIGGSRLGVTPLTTLVTAGTHRVDWLRAGFKPGRTRLDVEPGVARSTAAPALTPADGNVVLTSDPEGAAVTVDGVFEGRTPLELDLSPGDTHRLSFSKAGFETEERELRLEPGASETVAVALAEQLAELLVRSRPPGAEVLVAGEPRGTTTADGLTVLLAGAGPYELEVRKEGYLAQRVEVTPRPGLDQSLEVDLKTAEEERAERTPPVIRTAAGQEMRLVPGGRFEMGAPRREPGRRPNEVERQVELTRPFYVAVHEVSNAEYRAFDLSHLSGSVGSATLELDDHPVVQVSWAAAARYCNWLSEKDSLPPAYALRDGRLEPVEPMNTGYRLPTEAEWAWVARYPEPPAARKYPWGGALPIPPLAGNFGDRSAAPLLARTLPSYDDGYPATAPIDAFEPNPLGLFHLGGNVAEWIHDRYADDPRSADGPERDPFGPEQGETHVIRGASWTTATLTALRLSYRDSGSEARHDVGFRVVRYAE